MVYLIKRVLSVLINADSEAEAKVYFYNTDPKIMDEKIEVIPMNEGDIDEVLFTAGED